MWRLCVLVVVGCGRVNFDARGMDVGDAQPDTTDASMRCDVMAPFAPPVLVDGLNTGSGDITLRLTGDELSGAFWSLRTGEGELYAAQRADRVSSFAARIVPELNAAGAIDADPTLPPDGSFIAFASDRSGGVGGFDLYEAPRVGAGFGPPIAIAALDTVMNETTPTFSMAESSIYYASNASGATRICRAHRTGLATYEPGAEVGELSSGGNDEEFDIAPSEDGLVAYFRSTRPGGPGGGDIFVTLRSTTADPWGVPVLVDGINSSAVDGPSFLSRDLCRLYFTSDRSGIASLYVASR